MNIGNILGSISPAFGIASGHGLFGKPGVQKAISPVLGGLGGGGMGGGGGGGADPTAANSSAIANMGMPANGNTGVAPPAPAAPAAPGGHAGLNPQMLQGILSSLSMMAPGGRRF